MFYNTQYQVCFSLCSVAMLRGAGQLYVTVPAQTNLPAQHSNTQGQLAEDSQYNSYIHSEYTVTK